MKIIDWIRNKFGKAAPEQIAYSSEDPADPLPKVALRLGRLAIEDLRNIQPEEIDLAAIDPRLATIKRFSSNPKALNVLQHQFLCQEIALDQGYDMNSPEVFLARHHDDAEAFTCDIPHPIKQLISEYTSILQVLEKDLDEAILQARINSTELVPNPDRFDEKVIKTVKTFDAIALTMERMLVLKWPRDTRCYFPPDPMNNNKLLFNLGDWDEYPEDEQRWVERILEVALGKCEYYMIKLRNAE